jgi:hypothetical protein
MIGGLTCEQPDHGEYASGNIFLRRVQLAKAGDVLHGHTHNFDHTTFVVRGAVRVVATCEGGCMKPKVQDFGEGQEFRHFLVQKHWTHEITALTDDVEFYCIYSHRTPQGDVVQDATGWREAYV